MRLGFKKILFPTDFSANAGRALAHAVRLADFDNGEVIVQHVVGDYFAKHPHWATLFDVRGMHKYIAEVASEVGANLTILGTHEYGSVHKYLLGTTTDRLLAATSTPILTVKV